MEAPKLLKNESFVSFRKRVAMWEKKTGKTYPRSKRISMRGSVEDRILDGAIQMTGITPKIDYSKDYNLDDEAKEYSLAGGYSKYKDSKEGKEFIRQELAIQEAITQEKKEDFALQASKGIDYDAIDTSQVDNAQNVLNELKGKNKKEISISTKKTKNEVYEDEHPLSDPDYNPESTKKNRPIKRGAIEKENVKRFGKDVVDELKNKHAEWKEARKSGTLDKWREKWKNKKKLSIQY